jgi:hypothetical protein
MAIHILHRLADALADPIVGLALQWAASWFRAQVGG